MSAGAWQREVASLVEGTLHSSHVLVDLDLQGQDRQPARDAFYDLVLWLARSRAESLLLHDAEPPRSLAAILHADAATRAAACQRACREWQILLQVERLVAEGPGVVARQWPTTKVQWRHNRWVRLILALLERGDTHLAQRHVRYMSKGLGTPR